MRNALLTFVLTFFVSGFFVAAADAADGVSDSIFTEPAVNAGSSPLDDDRGLLPIRGSELPISGAVDTNGVSHDMPHASIIEAIPTPTAFHTGAFLLAAIFVGRNYRKLLSKFVAA